MIETVRVGSLGLMVKKRKATQKAYLSNSSDGNGFGNENQ